MNLSKILPCLLLSLLVSWPAAADDVERARQACATNHLLNTAYDCGCIARKFAAAWDRDKSPGFPNVFNTVITTQVTGCVQPEAIRAASLERCGMTYKSAYARLYDRRRLGKAAFCHCLADESVKLLAGMDPKSIPTLAAGSPRALLTCRKTASYAVPADSPFHPPQPVPVAALPDRAEVRADDGHLYLIIVNRNFDLDRLDQRRYRVSDDYQSDRNLKYVTPKESPVETLPAALVRRANGVPGIIETRSLSDIADVAQMYGQAILVRGPQLQAVLRRIERVSKVTSVDYYTVADDTLYAVPDLPSRLQGVAVR
ncbi:hypothetical protein [Reyranella sp.]|uniref:hypothetical protein n=1 Tax=Reyranella sp. TaxID=1929291 RepID=UPI003BA8A697